MEPFYTHWWLWNVRGSNFCLRGHSLRPHCTSSIINCERIVAPTGTCLRLIPYSPTSKFINIYTIGISPFKPLPCLYLRAIKKKRMGTTNNGTNHVEKLENDKSMIIWKKGTSNIPLQLTTSYIPEVTISTSF